MHLLSFPFSPSTFRKIVCQVHHPAKRHGITSVLCSINLMYNQRQEQRQRIDKNVWSFVCKMQSASKYYSHSSSNIYAFKVSSNVYILGIRQLSRIYFLKQVLCYTFFAMYVMRHLVLQYSTIFLETALQIKMSNNITIDFFMS